MTRPQWVLIGARGTKGWRARLAEQDSRLYPLHVRCYRWLHPFWWTRAKKKSTELRKQLEREEGR